MSPSQQLDSYLSHHEDLAPPTAENLKFSFKTPTSRIASRIAPTAMPNEGYLNTATSHLYPQQHQQPFATDHSTSSPNADNEAPDILELRLAEAEERLRQHSTLLSLFLDISSSDDQLQQLELREEENQTVRARRQQKQQKQSVSQVLERAERPTLYKDSKTSISSGSARINFSRHEERLFSIPRAATTTTNSPPEKNKNKITEEVLLQKLAHFDEETASLKARLEVTKPYSSSFFSFNTGHSIDKKSGLEVASSSSLEKKEHLGVLPRQKSNSVAFIPALHTLKSAAAAVATRKLIENDLENNQDCQKSFDRRGGGGASIELKNLHKAAALLKPRPGSTTALISEVAALRKRVANSLACIEESSLSSSHVDGADLSNTMPLSSFSPEVSLFNLSNSVLN
jgi:hypothetical protein